jgi:hypothetical protein
MLLRPRGDFAPAPIKRMMMNRSRTPMFEVLTELTQKYLFLGKIQKL